MVTLPRRWLGADTLRRICKASLVPLIVHSTLTSTKGHRRLAFGHEARLPGKNNRQGRRSRWCVLPGLSAYFSRTADATELLSAKANTPHEALKSKKRLHGDLERLSSTSDGVDGRQAPKKRRCSPHDSATGSESFSSESNVVPAPAAPAPTLSTTTKSTVYITAQDIDRLFRTNDPSLLEDSAEPAPGEIITFFLADQIALCHALRARLFSSTSTRKASTVYRQALEAVQCWSVLHSPSDFQERPGSSSLRVSILQARSHFIDVPCLSRAGTVNAGPRVRHPNSTGPSPPKGDAISHAIDGRGPWWYSASVASHAAIKATGGRTSRSSNIRIGLLEVDQKGWNLQDGRPEGVEEIDWYLDGIKEVAPEKVDSIDAVMEDLFAR